LVAATNRNLEQMVQSGQFRSDLLFRISSFVIELPPLRERKEDIKELARYYMDRFCERYGLSPKGSCPDFMETLLAYTWPGNIREFINTIERTVVAAREAPVLFAQHLPTPIRIQVAQSGVSQHKPEQVQRVLLSPGELPKLNEFRENVYTQAEKQYLTDLMTLANKDIPEACRLSGLSQSRLYALLKEHELPRSQ
jgi:two-component system, NtrC family, response regulator